MKALFLLFFVFLMLQCHIGDCYKNEVQIALTPEEETTTPKSGFFSGFKNFFRGSPTTTTTTTTTTLRPFVPERVQAPLMPLGPRPDTPPYSPFGGQSPQFPQTGGSGVPHSQVSGMPYQPQGLPQHSQGQPLPPHSQSQGGHPQPQHTLGLPQHSQGLPQQAGVTNNQGNRFDNSPNLPPGFSTSFRPQRPQPSPFDLSYGGVNSGGHLPSSGNRPNIGLAPMVGPSSTTSSTSTTTTTTTARPSRPTMDFDLRVDTSSSTAGTSTTTRRPSTPRDEFPALPPPRKPSIGGHEDFPALPTPKSPTPSSPTPQRPSSPSAWNTTPIPPRTGALTPSQPSPPIALPTRPDSTGPTGGNRVSFIPTSGSTTTVRPGTNPSGSSLASDDEIRQLTENLYTKEVNNQLAHIQVDIQGKTRSIDSGDEAPRPLLTVDQQALQPETIAKMIPLFNNYEVDTSVNEHVTPNERREENEFLDAVMNTAVMRQAMLFLQNKGLVTPDPKTHRDLVKELWFTQYSRGGGRIGSSGFEHVFVNEVKNGTIIGLHNWVYFNEEEKAGRLDYKGYLHQLDMGTKAKVLKVRFTHNGLNKPVNSLFIGTSPELELALYTVCFQLRPDRTCPVSLGNSRFGIVTYSWRYRGKSLIGSAYPEI